MGNARQKKKIKLKNIKSSFWLFMDFIYSNVCFHQLTNKSRSMKVVQARLLFLFPKNKIDIINLLN